MGRSLDLGGVVVTVAFAQGQWDFITVTCLAIVYFLGVLVGERA